ncbi:SusE domain-containing protein [Labilibacter marinus]|uniref:SusE domain-containing protein n=1 Tax=Labilibacter marinus TaxID=1477105 RepID=UPI00095008FE|nr:SusE domain-containing protein [Labilibacter marinus]
MYKNINILLALLVMLMAWGCEEKSNLQPEGQWELSTPTQLGFSGGDNVVLDESKPNEELLFSWHPAESSAKYNVSYELHIVKSNASPEDLPIMVVESTNGGKDTKAVVLANKLDEAMSMADFPANEVGTIKYVVKAICLSKVSNTTSDEISVKRFETEIIPEQLFVSGEATENGDDLSKAIQLKRLNDEDLNPSNKYEVYTKLLADKTFMFYSGQSLPAHKYGGAEGELVKSGVALSVSEEAVYKINIDLDNNTYALFKVDFIGAIGGVFETGWGGDQLLEYQGLGVFKASINFIDEGGFILRSNKDWVNIMKRVVGTTDQLVAESDAESQGVSYEDIPTDVKGVHILTIDLSANGYTYSIEEDPDAPEGSDPIEAPETLFLLGDGTIVDQLTKDGDVFTTTQNLALQTGVTYQLNTASDGTGKSYTIDVNLGVTDAPDGARVSVSANMFDVAGDIAVEREQAYQLEINFTEAILKWSYYNLFMFHWDEQNQGWDDREEFLMTYEHPYKWNLTADLTADFDHKFFSPWDNDFGSDDPSALSGTMTNKGGSNFTNIINSGTYKVSVELTSDYSTGTYEFVVQ